MKAVAWASALLVASFITLAILAAGRLADYAAGQFPLR